jgi:hypothetical protein
MQENMRRRNMNMTITMDRSKMGNHMVLGDRFMIKRVMEFMKDNVKMEI